MEFRTDLSTVNLGSYTLDRALDDLVEHARQFRAAAQIVAAASRQLNGARDDDPTVVERLRLVREEFTKVYFLNDAMQRLRHMIAPLPIPGTDAAIPPFIPA